MDEGISAVMLLEWAGQVHEQSMLGTRHRHSYLHITCIGMFFTLIGSKFSSISVPGPFSLVRKLTVEMWVPRILTLR